MINATKLKKRASKVKHELSKFIVNADNIDQTLDDIFNRVTIPKEPITPDTQEPEYLVIDLFCGAGGTTTGFEKTNGLFKVIACINHDYQAIKSHWSNHPDVAHFEEDIRLLNIYMLKRVVDAYRKLYPKAKIILWASLECTNFSKAKGGASRDADSRTLAQSLLQTYCPDTKTYIDGDSYIQILQPDYVMIENVVEFMSWGPMKIRVKKKHDNYWELKTERDKKTKELGYAWEPISKKNGQDWLAWRRQVNELGYRDDWTELNSADFGAYTSRNRLFGMFAKKGLPTIFPEPTHAKKINKGMFGSLAPWKPVRDVLDFEDEGHSIFTRTINMALRPQDRHELSENTLKRVYAGLKKYVAGGEENFMIKYNSMNSNGNYCPPSLSEPCPVISTQNRLGVVQISFLQKYFSGRPEGKVISVDGPSGTITTVGNQALVNAQFLSKAFSGNPNDKNSDLDKPAGTITTVDHHQLVSASFLAAYYSTGHNTTDVNNPAPTLGTKDTCALIQAFHFLEKCYSDSHNHQSINQPAGTIVGTDKHRLVTAVPFLISQNYNNGPSSIENPCPTITANRKWHYLVNPSWFGNPGSVDKPCPTIVARQDKAPLYLIQSEEGDVAIVIYESDSPTMKLIKEFMAMYHLADIKMRMLKVPELLRIQGFPAKYKLAGSQADQKKFIGNSVVPEVVTQWALAIHKRNRELKTMAA